MAKWSLSVLVIVCSLVVVAPVTDAQTQAAYKLTVSGQTHEVGVNGVFARLCEGRSAQILSKKTGFPLDKVKEGVLMGEVTLTSDGKTFPFDLHLKDATVTAANVRSNGTWTMTLGWSSCARTEKKKK